MIFTSTTHSHRLCAAILVLLSLGGCGSVDNLKTVENVDLERFMGDWYVIANIPTPFEKDVYNAVETYELDEDGNVPTTFTFRDGAFDGKEKTYTPKGFPKPESNNAVWGMQFIWPIKADYRIVHLEDDYSVTIVGRNKRDYVWLMARTPQIPDADYARLISKIEAMGYDLANLRKVPQQW